MSRLLAVLVASMVVVLAVGGVLEDQWVLGLLYAGVGARALYDWVRVRRGDTPASTVVNGMLVYVAVLLFGLCLPAWAAIEASLAGG